MVRDTGASNGNGAPATGNFPAGMMKSLSSLKDLLDLGGMNLPEFPGKAGEEAVQPPDAQARSAKGGGFFLSTIGPLPSEL